jgi:four helix bundle protein
MAEGAPVCTCGLSFIQDVFLNIAQGSIEECRYYLILVKDLGYGDTYETKLLLQEVSKFLEAYSWGILTPDS